MVYHQMSCNKNLSIEPVKPRTPEQREKETETKNNKLWKTEKANSFRDREEKQNRLLFLCLCNGAVVFFIVTRCRLYRIQQQLESITRRIQHLHRLDVIWI